MMNRQLSKVCPAGRWFSAALLALVLFSAIAARAEEQRWLLVFDTSSAMKKRLPAVEAEIGTLLTKELTNSLKAGDSIGIWTFDEKLHAGNVPLLTWDPKAASDLATNLTHYIHRQNYSGSTRFAALQPTLGSVIGGSERLTVIIVCDGEDEIHGTPYDDGINETLKQTRDARKKALQPYVIALRTQLGKYIGGTVNFPPMAVNLTPFPLLPREIAAAQAPPPKPPAPVVKPAPVPVVPPLVIVGTRVSNDTNDVAKALESRPPVVAAPQAPVQPVAPPVAAPVVTPIPEPVPSAPAQATKETAVTKAPVAPTPEVSAPTPVVPVPEPAAPAAAPAVAPVVKGAPASVTNAVVAAVSGLDKDTKVLTYVGISLLVVAVALVVFLVRHRPGPRGSLITGAMQSNPRPPEQK